MQTVTDKQTGEPPHRTPKSSGSVPTPGSFPPGPVERSAQDIFREPGAWDIAGFVGGAVYDY